MPDCCASAGDLHVAIIGSGAAAFACALECVEQGSRVTLIERDTVGGTCVNVGCVPSKIMIRAAQLTQQQRRHPFAAVPVYEPQVDHQALAAQILRRVDELRHDKYESLLDSRPGITLLRADARFVNANTLEVRDSAGTRQLIRPDRVLIATGAAPRIPAIPGLADTPFWTSTDALQTTGRPDHLIVIGGSVVAVELAQAYRRLGAEVTMLVRSRILSRESPAISEALTAALVDEGMTVVCGHAPESVHHGSKGFTVRIGNREITGDRLLVAAGRRPNTETLNLGVTGIRCTDSGAVPVDASMRTAEPGVFAAGDCSTQPQYVYVAAAAGRRAAMVMHGQQAHLDLEAMPAVVFTDPQVATVGLDADAAERQGLEVVTRRLPLKQVPRALANFQTRGFIELVAAADSGRLLGAQIVAPEAGEMVQTAAMAIRSKMTVGQLAASLFAYLTWSEGLKLCAQAFEKDVTQLSCCAA